MKAEFKGVDAKDGKISFVQIMDAFRENIAEGNALESDGPLKFTPGSKETGWKASLSVEPGLQVPDPEALKFIENGLEKELGPGMAQRVFAESALDGAKQVVGRELAALEESYKRVRSQILKSMESLHRPTVEGWKKAAATGVSDASPSTDLTLKQLLEHPEATFRISDSGSGGAIIVSIPGGKGAVVKIEDKDSVERSQKLSGLMKDTLPTGPKGFNVSDVETLTDLSAQQETVGLLVSKLKELQGVEGMSEAKLNHITKHLQKLEDPEISKSIGISKMEFVPGIQVNTLDLDNKVALLQSGVLAEQVGKAAVYSQLAGLCDHVAITDGGTNNLSNFMIDPKTGKLAPIDLDTKNIGTEEKPFYGVRNAGPALKDLAGFVKGAGESPEALSEAISRLVKDQSVSGASGTPLQEPICMMTVPGGREGLIKPDTAESRLLKETLNSPELKERQAISMLRGVSSALKEVGGDKEKLNAAFEKHESGMSPEEFEEFTQAIDGIDFEKLDQQLDQYEQQYQQKLTGQAWDKRQQEGLQAKVPAQQDLDKLAKLQTRLEKLSQDKPPLGERFKAFFTPGGIEAMKAKVATEIEKTKLDITAKLDGGQFDARMEQHQGRVENLKEQRSQMLPGAMEHQAAKQQLKGDLTMMALDEAQGKTLLNRQERSELGAETEDLRKKMDGTKKDFDGYQKAGKELDQSREVVSHGEKKKSVREALGKSVGEGHGHEVRHSQKL